MLNIKALLANILMKLNSVSYAANYIKFRKVNYNCTLSFGAGELYINQTYNLTPPDAIHTIPFAIAGWHMNSANSFLFLNSAEIQNGATDDSYILSVRARHTNRSSSSDASDFSARFQIIWRSPEANEYDSQGGGGGTVDVTPITDAEIYAITRNGEEDE